MGKKARNLYGVYGIDYPRFLSDEVEFGESELEFIFLEGEL